MGVSVRLTGTLDGLRIIDRKLQSWEDRASDVRPAYGELRAVFASVVQQTFDSEGGTSASGPWAPLAPSTARQRGRLSYGADHPILERTGEIIRSLTQVTGDTILVEQPTYFAIGSAVPYLIYHQSLAPRTKIPRRPVFDPTEDDKHALLRPLRVYVTGKTAAVNLS